MTIRKYIVCAYILYVYNTTAVRNEVFERVFLTDTNSESGQETVI